MNIKHAQYMLTVWQEGSVTNAARKLYISQPSLSQMIKLVEKNLNAPIFNRSTDPISLTYAGEKYMEAARKVLAINDNLIKEICEINEEDHGKMSVGCPIQRGLQILPHCLSDFIKEYPHVEVEVVEQGSNHLEVLVEEGKLDLAMVTTSPKYNTLEYRHLSAEHPMLVVNKNSDFALSHEPGTIVTVSEARDLPFVSIKEGHSIRAIQNRLFYENSMTPKILLETDSIEVAKRVTAACNAVMLCPDSYIGEEDLMGNIAAFPIRCQDYDRHFYLCYRKDKYLTKYMSAFADIVAAHC